ncbi:N-acetylmannosamine-6-phosphate 2-epimerase [Frigoribacterium sp. CG_9.8]|uniref:N-acetylmannosamine-6-phosphate 2-epimerase n=1 Tax=Frigoribacterium sp. CG_9.8 TaxID=2787733 RepID=UPI0018CB71C6|nr:putative N-acetylmannosamine-6-phosphate 2-epimerase [Frigoribacterium sp. CG_9.8]MBG6107391.1 N-acylglucosamine-6-phosphate 2-epimerase [Frigoribacterium sp. CG_9.8]
MPNTITESEQIRGALVTSLHGVVVASCQAGPGSPLNQPSMIAALARSAELGGAQGFRVDGPANVAAVRAVSELPILGINKVDRDGFDVRITPTLKDALDIVAAGANIVALDGTERARPYGETLSQIISALHELGIPVMADISTRREAEAAAEAGADIVATTLAGYTPYTSDVDKFGPAFPLLEEIRELPVPVAVEGRIWTTDHVTRCFEGGAYFVIIGSAITVPELITRRFVAAAHAAGLIDAAS